MAVDAIDTSQGSSEKSKIRCSKTCASVIERNTQRSTLGTNYTGHEHEHELRPQAHLLYVTLLIRAREEDTGSAVVTVDPVKQIVRLSRTNADVVFPKGEPHP